MSRFEFPNNDGREYTDLRRLTGQMRKSSANPHVADVNCAGPDLPRERQQPVRPGRIGRRGGPPEPIGPQTARRVDPQRFRGCNMDLPPRVDKIEWLE